MTSTASISGEANPTIHQPIHPSIRAKLDPQYVAYHEKYLQYSVPIETLSWDPALRVAPAASSAGRSAPVEVGSIRDLDRSHYQVRIFTPKGSAPAEGWPVFVWLHGGGWVMGGLGSENSFLTAVCSEISCVVISINYRHAPEYVYPAAINDVVEGFTWVVSADGAQEFGIDTNRVAIGGLSAGGGLAAILSLKAALSLPHQEILLQILIVPTLDNTATAETVWASNRHAPWLTPERMIWYRRKYLPFESTWANWDASPTFAPPSLLAKSPKTWIAVAELDILCEEGRIYGEKLKDSGVETDVVVYPGSTHSVLTLDGYALSIGKKLVRDAIEQLAIAFKTS